jgi:hypothetical protein
MVQRYFEGLSEHAKKLRRKELERRKTDPNPGLGKSDEIFLKSGKARPSRFTTKFRKVFPHVRKPGDLSVLSKGTGIPLKILEKVYQKGLGAWKSGGSRPGANAHQWALARAYKFILVVHGHHPLNPKDPDLHLYVSFAQDT